MKKIKTTPGAKRLMESLRHVGYNCSAAVADLVDNSIVADASEIWIDILPRQDRRMDMIPKQEYRPAAIIIADNGNGMSREELHEAMRFGTSQKYSLGDLGKYGLGLKTASLSQCRVLTVASKAKAKNDIRPRRHWARWDIDHVYETDDWNLLIPDENELEIWEKELLNQKIAEENGTVILWSGLSEALPQLSSENIGERERFLARLIDEISSHLQMVFHRFMQGGITGRRRLNIFICGKPLAPWDPFCRNESTRELNIIHLPVNSVNIDGVESEKQVIISPFILPREDEFSSGSAWKNSAGPKNWNQQQGLYFYRNGRLLQAGGWSRLRTPDEHTKLLRIAVDFPSELDKAFQVNITKMRASIPVGIRERIKSFISTWAKEARARYDSAPSKEFVRQKPYKEPEIIRPAGESAVSAEDLIMPDLRFIHNTENHEITFEENTGKNRIVISIPRNHELSGYFPDSDKHWDIRRFSSLILSILEAVRDGIVSAERVPVEILKKIFENYL